MLFIKRDIGLMNVSRDAFYKKNKNFLKKFLKSPKYAINKGV